MNDTKISTMYPYMMQQLWPHSSEATWRLPVLILEVVDVNFLLKLEILSLFNNLTNQYRYGK